MTYATGSVAVTRGSAAVTGSGTAWLANAEPGDKFVGPDGRSYIIAGVSSDTALTLADAYRGKSETGARYSLHPVSGTPGVPFRNPLPHYASREAFENAVVQDWVEGWTLYQGGVLLSFVRDPAGTAIQSANGVCGSPDGEPQSLHYGIGAPSVMSMLLDIERGDFRAPLTLDSDLTIDNPITFRNGAYIDGGVGPTLTIRAPVIADRASWIFRGDYTLALTNAGADVGENARDVHAAWFGAFPGSLALGDQAPFIHRGFAAMGNARESRMLFEIGNYNVNSIIDVTRGGLVQGTGQRRTVFKAMSDFGAAFRTVGDACYFQDVQFEDHNAVDRAEYPWIEINHNGCKVRRVSMGSSALGLVVDGLNTIVDEVGAAYATSYGAGSSLILIKKGQAKVSNVYRLQGTAGPEALVAVGTGATGTISAVSISDVRWDATSLGVFLDARDVSLSRISVGDLTFSGPGAVPELIRAETGGENNLTNIIIDGVLGSGAEGRMVGFYQNSSGATRKVVFSNLISAGSEGEGIRLEENAGTMERIIIDDSCDLADKAAPLVRVGTIGGVRIGPASNILGTMPSAPIDILDLAPGGVMTISLGRSVFSARMFLTAGGVNHGDFAARIASSPNITKISGTSIVVGANTALLSASDGNITVGVTDGQVQIRNGTASAIRGTITILAGN